MLARLALFLFLFSTPVLAFAAEKIDSFIVDYTIEQDGSVVVTERIVYDFGDAERHGIFRIIRPDHPQPATAWYKNRYIDLDLGQVLRDGATEPYQLSKQGDTVEIKIGDPDATISGAHTYEIVYTLRGALSYGPLGSEFYYNVTGNSWPVVIENVTARVNSNALTDTFTCYQGISGSTDTCALAERNDNTITFTQSELVPGEGLTIAAGLDPDLVEEMIYETTYLWMVIKYVMLAGWLVFLIVYLWHWRRREKDRAPIIAQYEPYQDYLPMYTGVLFDQTLDARDVTAGIIYLAEQGFIKIIRTSRTILFAFDVTDYDIELRRPTSEIPTEFLRSVSELIFSSTDPAGTVVALSKLSHARVKNARILQELRSKLSKDLKTNGFTTDAFPKHRWPYMLLIAAVLAVLSPVVLVISIIIALIGLLIPRYTKKGFEAQHHIKGFKLFLSVTDAERFKFHNAPDKNPELFMKYLPYAVALGVEKEWAKVFEDITLPQPDWYVGTGGAFSASALTSDLSQFSSSLSTSSGTSGSSGGGSSGGGGGGGGGGSW